MAYYNNLSKITVYEQITDSSCATTCLCMVMNVPPATVQAAGYNLDFTDWSGVSNHFGYNAVNKGALSYSQIVSWLKKGYPVIAKIASLDYDPDDHWVVIAAFAGDESNPTPPYFTCADPADGSTRQLSRATYFNHVYNTFIVEN